MARVLPTLVDSLSVRLRGPFFVDHAYSDWKTCRIQNLIRAFGAWRPQCCPLGALARIAHLSDEEDAAVFRVADEEDERTVDPGRQHR